ncbi:hypothetical protein T484DRAFT_1969110 [Baffinella frigidus]|nr:hypothetical protein T484DRAFT_1969110 [Cryptophyta sp. CCMP2293]
MERADPPCIECADPPVSSAVPEPRPCSRASMPLRSTPRPGAGPECSPDGPSPSRGNSIVSSTITFRSPFEAGGKFPVMASRSSVSLEKPPCPGSWCTSPACTPPAFMRS